MALKEVIDQNTCLFSITACITLTFCYVASLYVWRSKLSRSVNSSLFLHYSEFHEFSSINLFVLCFRDHPSTIKRRFFSVFCVMLLAPFLTQYFLTEETINRGDMYEQLGLRSSGLIIAIVAPLFLTAILFLGPLTMHVISGSWKLYAGIVWFFMIFKISKYYNSKASKLVKGNLPPSETVSILIFFFLLTHGSILS